jgi:hypothetical protein
MAHTGRRQEPYRLFIGDVRMKAKKGKTKLIMFFMCSLLVAISFSVTPFCMADDHKNSGKHYDKHGDRKGDGVLGGLLRGRHDEGNETTGQIVAWNLAVANLTVALSVIIRGLKKFAPLAPETKNTLSRFNSTQKKYLMRFHYLLNPLIFVVAVIHWTLSKCKSTALPEWGLVTMGAIVSLGIILKFKLCSKELLLNVYKIHTNAVILILMISLLLIGHLSMD